MSRDPKTVTGWVSGIAAAIVVNYVEIAACTATGVANVAKGEKFSAAWDDYGTMIEKAFETAGEAGDKHHDAVVRGAITGVVGTTTGRAVSGVIGPHHHQS
jgi:hypothetical protein